MSNFSSPFINSEHATRRGWTVVGEYIDQGISGSRERRPELDRLWVDCRKRKVDAVVVYRYDRFARSLRHLVNALEGFRALGIDFVSLHEGVDTSTPNGRPVFGSSPVLPNLSGNCCDPESILDWQRRKRVEFASGVHPSA